jgi:hypothetical protein
LRLTQVAPGRWLARRSAEERQDVTHSVWFETDGETATRRVIQVLSRRGFRVLRSFDLRSAAAQWNTVGHDDCLCPHHGTEQCTCQYSVLLVYGEQGGPTIVTVHGRDTQTEVQVQPEAEAAPETGTIDQVALAVCEAALAGRMPEP